jgi:hypothetical protein
VIGDIDSPLANLALSATSLNTTLIPQNGIAFGGAGANRTVTFTPAANQSGNATVTITVSDGQASASTQVRITVTAVNDPPTISDIPNQSVQAGSSTGSIAFTVDDPDTAVANLTLSAGSSNANLIPQNAITFGGSGNSRTINVTPAAGGSGTATVTVTVSDGSLSATDSFTVTVSAVVEAPKIVTPPENITVNEGGTISFGVTASGTAPLSFQWILNGQDIQGATGSTLTIRAASADQAGKYTVRVSNSAGNVTSPAATLVVQRLDFGDAPDGSLSPAYPTLLAKDGARHVILSGFSLGPNIDSETDALISADATGDDKNGAVDDEDGVEFVTNPLIAGQPATVRVTLNSAAGTAGRLDAFIDFNGDGVWTLPGERVFTAQLLVPGINTLTFSVPADAKLANTFARFRLSREGNLGPSGLASSGEVEDYSISIAAAPPPAELDFGDAPDSVPGAVGLITYPTLLINNGARHMIQPGFFLGKSVDGEKDGQPNSDATGDDLNPEKLDDEDGVEFLTPLVPGQSARVAVTASQAGHLDAWVDFNRNRSWADQGEQIFTSISLASGLNTLTFAVPPSAQGGVTYARFRLSKNGKLGPVGQAPDGEVEDYKITIESPAPCDASYRGTDFWLTFPGNYPPSATAPLKLTLCIAGAPGTTGTVAIGGLRFSTDFTIPAAGSSLITLPDAASLGDVNDVVQTKGIHVTSSATVAVYGLNRIPYSSDGYLGLPLGVIGKEYIVASYPNVFTEVSALNGTQFGLVASEDDTTVTVIPSVTILGHPKGEPYYLQLKKGQTYQLRHPQDATADLTGTELIADKPIAVFGGHQCANINSPGKLFCDHLVEQLLPVSAWSKVFYTVPLATRISGDSFRVVAAEDATKLFVNGVESATIDRAQVHTLSLTSAARLNSDKPVYVSQFANSSDFDNVKNADPFMVTVPPVRFYATNHLVCTGPGDFSAHFVNIVAPANVVGVLTLDGAAVAAGSFTAIGATGFSFARLTLTAGRHVLAATQPFATILYGFGSYESYAWPGGMYFGDITPPTVVCPPDFTVSLGTVNSTTGAVTCKASVPDLRPQTTVTDNCQLPSERVLTQIPQPGTLVGVGTYPILLIAQDASGNQASCVVTMTVVDKGTVAITCPKDLAVRCNKGSGANVAFQVLAQTACGTAMPVVCTPASGSFFGTGTTPVKCQVKDSPNQACTFNVVVTCPSTTLAGPLLKQLDFSWTDDSVLETALSIDGPWTLIPEAVPPFTPAQFGAQQFFRLRQAQDASPSKSSWSAPLLLLE